MKSITKDALAAINVAADVAALGGTAEIGRALGSSAQAGLTAAQVAAARAAYGANTLPQKKPRAFWEHLKEAFEDSTLQILCASAVFSTGFGVFLSDSNADVIQGLAIMLAVVIVSGVNSFQNWSKDREFGSLAKIKADRPVQVVREGKEVRVARSVCRWRARQRALRHPRSRAPPRSPRPHPRRSLHAPPPAAHPPPRRRPSASTTWWWATW